MGDRSYKVVLFLIVFFFGIVISFLLFQLFRGGPDHKITPEQTEAKKKKKQEKRRKQEEKKPSGPKVKIWDAPPDASLSLRDRLEELKSRITGSSSKKKREIRNHTLAFIRAGKLALPRLKETMKSSHPKMRAWAARTIGELFTAGPLMNDPDQQITFDSVKKSLVRCAKKDPVMTVREEAILALGKVGTQESRGVLNSLKEEVKKKYLRKRIEFARQIPAR